MGLTKYLVRRTLEFIPVIFAAIILNFILIHLAPGDISTIMAGEQAVSLGDTAYMEKIVRTYGLDKPLHVQFVIYMSKVLRGDLGNSYLYQRPVISLIIEKIPATFLLVFTSVVIAVIVGTLLGTLASKRIGSKLDFGITISSLVIYSIPVFWLSLMLVLVFGIQLRWFPYMGFQSVITKTGLEGIFDKLWHLVLPATSLSTVWIAQFVRLSRASIVDVMKEDFITTARAVGLKENAVFFKHALRNALLPIVTVAGLQMGFILAGSLLVETVFSWPGMGRLIMDALINRDYPLIMGCYIVISLCVVVANLAVDLFYSILDPRVAYEQ